MICILFHDEKVKEARGDLTCSKSFNYKCAKTHSTISRTPKPALVQDVPKNEIICIQMVKNKQKQTNKQKERK